ncbi:MAG: DUF2239 family protein [Steroidobacteraceae bacterium]
MTGPASHSCTRGDGYTAFDGHRRLASGPLQAVARAVQQAAGRAARGPVLIFDDATGRSIDIDMRAEADIGGHAADAPTDAPRGRGRPRLGVIAREVTLLPRHWEWLATQPGGASVALRKLVEEARRSHADQDLRRRVQERAYHFMSAMAGDMPGFEEAARALFANDRPRLCELIAAWPEDVRDYASMLACGADEQVRG